MTCARSTILAITFLASPVMLFGADTTVIAKVGEIEVKADDIKPFIEKLPPKNQLILSKDPAAMNEFVRTIIIQQMVYKQALAAKWEQQPQIAAQLDQIRQHAITQSYLQSQATPPSDYPFQADLQAGYDLLKKNNALQVPKQYHLAQIYIACPKGADKELESKAQAKLDLALKALKSGDFATVAKSQSDDVASAQRGGELGFISESQVQPEIRNIATSLLKGSVSDPVRMKDGWHIVKLVEIREPYTATFDEVKNSLVTELRAQKAQALGKAYLAKLTRQNPITLNEIAVSKLIDLKGN